MPSDPLVTAIVSSVVSSVVEGVLAPPPPAPPDLGIFRVLPEVSRNGEMRPPWKGQVQIDGKTYLLSPAVQFRDELNMIIFPEMVRKPVKVRYMTDYSGAINRVWILSATEARLAEKR